MATSFLDQLGSFFNGANGPQSGPSYQAMFKFSNLHPRVQGHLSKVYAVLAFATLAAAVGSYTYLAIGISGFLTQIGAIGCMLALAWTPNTPANLSKRLGCLGGFAFCQGAAIGPLISVALQLSPAALVTAFAATAAVFVSFSLSALVTKRRSFMYLGGYLASAMMAMLVLRLSGWIFGASALAYSVELYGGLLVFSAYILYDTQLIVERASAGEMDFTQHALLLFTDLFAVFVRILIIMLKRSEEDKRRERARERKRS
mmetsp:Transcript_19355/g.57409  ORF Transcript_19355/g.57409 Transcript_19355/m.57409 type:complete len:259 (-) Transcript_19355:357-1133(-)